MLKILLWFVSHDDLFLNLALKILERQNDGIDLIGVTASQEISISKGGKKFPFIPFNRVNQAEFDVLLVVGAKQNDMFLIRQVARQLNFPAEKLLSDWITCIPGFTLRKYRHLQRSRLSILSMNCFGGCISSLLALQFLSPFVNLFLSADDFIKFLRKPRVYMAKEPRFEKLVDSSKEAPNGYPLLSLGDISLNMMHYSDKDFAISKWTERKQRINWYNLIAIALTDDKKILKQFDDLPQGKKICFVSFKSDLDSAWYIDPTKDKDATTLLDRTNNFGWGKVFYYDVFDMLLYGKKTLIDD